MNWFHLGRVAVGGWWGWFLTDLFSLVGEESTVQTFTYWEAFSVIGFVIVIVFMGIVTVSAIIDIEQYEQ